MSKKENRVKYGKQDCDIIAKSLDSSPDFCVYNALKYSKRIESVSGLNFIKRWYYRLILRKGGRSDYIKIEDYLTRLLDDGRYKKEYYETREKIRQERCKSRRG